MTAKTDRAKSLRKELTKIMGYKYLGDDRRYPKVDNAVMDILAHMETEVDNAVRGKDKEWESKIKELSKEYELIPGPGAKITSAYAEGWIEALDKLLKQHKKE